MFNSLVRICPSQIFLICAALLLASASARLIAVARTAYSAPAAPEGTPSFGPQRTITCAAGAIDIRPGNSIQGTVNDNPGATTFCLRAGVHYLSTSITPKTGNVFVGEYGAILDGTGWTTTDATQGAFRAHNQDINDVTIRNLVIRKMPQRGIHTYSSGWCANGTCNFSTAGADRWTIENNELAYNGVGVTVSNFSVVRNNYIHHNVGPDLYGDTNVLRGGGFNSYLAQGVVFENNEISYNGLEMKAASLSPNTTFRNNWVHHNLRNGIWYDGENTGAVIEGNLVEDNGGAGIFYEVSGQGVIRNNIARRNETGLLVSASHNLEVYGNTFEDNWRGMTYFVNCSVIDSPGGRWIGERVYMQNVSAHDNLIRVGSRAGSMASAFNYTACTQSQLDAYKASMSLTFTRNAYQVPDVTGQYWLWVNPLTWEQWRAVPQDATGTIR